MQGDQKLQVEIDKVEQKLKFVEEQMVSKELGSENLEKEKMMAQERKSLLEQMQ
jgi:hypothetical protein